MNRNPSQSRSLPLPAWIYIGALFTSSFDTFLAIDAGLTFRACQALLSIAMLAALLTSVHKSDVRLPPAIWILTAWTGVATLSMLLHGATLRAAGYSVWLAFNVFSIWATIQLFDTWPKILQLIRCYIFSFVFVACFGIFQFLAAVLGIGNFLVKQWWIDGRLPRVNGFSYEPSYFATYLLIGWVLVGYLLEQPRQKWIMHRLPLYFSIMSIALLLSSSRMAISVMLCWGVRSLWVIIIRPRVSQNTPVKLLATATVATLIAGISASSLNHSRFDQFKFLLEGTGLNGTSSHSVTDRSTGAMDVLNVFLDHPVLGVGLGGVSEEIMIKKGIPYDPKRYEGQCVAAEILAATGVIGFALFAGYFASLYRQGVNLCRTFGNSPEAPIIAALLYSLTAELIVLQFNQNVLRPYLWMHIAVLSSFIVFSDRSMKACQMAATSIVSPLTLPLAVQHEYQPR